LPKPGTDYDWDAPTKLETPGINGSTAPCPTVLTRYGSGGGQLRGGIAAAEQAHLGTGLWKPGEIRIKP
jgi:arabinosyltransferase B